MAPDHVAVLLAAGASTRLGTPKQLLTRMGETLVRRAARMLHSTAPRELVVVLGAHRVLVEDALATAPVRIVVNDDWEEGIASSLRCAAAAIGANRVLIALCDQPALSAEHLHALLACDGCAATSYDGRPGVPAVVDAALWTHAATLRGDRGFAALLAQRNDVVRLAAPALFVDIDTPAQLAEARAHGLVD